MGKDFIKILTIRKNDSQAPMAHAYNPSYSGGREIRRIMVKASTGQIVRETLS
jgi:hypothetical protein